MHQLPTLDVVVLVVYVLGVVGLGCGLVYRSRNTEGFMAAGRALPGWAVGLSIFGTYLSSNTFIGVPGKAYGTNWNFFVFSLSLPIAAVIATRYFVPFYRRSGEISAYHHLEARFGSWARSLAMGCYLLTQVARMGTIMLGVALALHALLGWDMTTIIVTTGILVTLYTLLGGIEAVIWTDVVQSIILMAGAVLVVALLLVRIPGGPSELLAVAAAHDKFSLGSLGTSLSEPTLWMVLVYAVVMNLNNFGIDQNFVQRYHAARDDRHARQSVWLGALLYVPVSAVFFFIGTCLFVYYQQPRQQPGLAEIRTQVAAEKLAKAAIGADDPRYATRLDRQRQQLTAEQIGDRVLPYFIATELPPGVAGLLIAAIFAAAMSSIDTSLNSSATIILSDFYRRWFRPQASERESMAVLYTATVAWGALGTGVAVALIGVQSLLQAWWILSGLFVGGMLGLFLLGLMARRAGSRAAAAGVIAAILIILWIILSQTNAWPKSLQPLRSTLHQLTIPVVSTLAILLVGQLVAWLEGKYRKKKA